MTQPGWGFGPWGDQAWGGPGEGSSVTPPTFAGITFATLTTFTSILIGWDPATDDVTPPGSIIYKIYKKISTDTFDYSIVYAVVVGDVTFLDTNNIINGQTYCYAVRAQDTDGNTDTNTAERCVTVITTNQDVTRFRKTYSFNRQQVQHRSNSTLDPTRWRKTYSFLRERPKLNHR